MADRYSFSLTTFSPSGKLVQIEHALAAVGKGTTTVGILARDGIVLATSKKPPTTLIDDTSLERVSFLAPQLGLCYSGMGPDARVLVMAARKRVQQYRQIYGEYPPVSILVKEVANIMQEYTQSGGVRPFGVSLLVAGVDHNQRPVLYQVDPSGAFFAWKATAVGQNAVQVRDFLEKRYDATMALDDAIHVALLALKDQFEGEMCAENVEVGIIANQQDTLGVAMQVGSGHGLGAVSQEPNALWFKKVQTHEIQDFLVNVA